MHVKAIKSFILFSFLIISNYQASQTLMSNLYKQYKFMIYANIKDLEAALQEHPLTEHQIKRKRILKEMEQLQKYRNQHLTFKKYQLSQFGFIKIQTQFENRMFEFQVFIDSEYPFNPPQVFYQHETSQYAYAQDLLENMLRGAVWGPSVLLNNLFDQIYYLAKLLYEEQESILASYHLNEIYEQEILQKYKVELFKIDSYTWKYMIKSTTKIVIGLTKQTLLKFTNQGSKLKLQSVIKIKEIKEVNASIKAGKFKLDIVTSTQANKNKLCFGGDKADIEKILYFMNPIQSIERKLNKLTKESYNSDEIQRMVKQYSDLIEYYSLRDPEKTKKYVTIVQNLIKNNYQNQMKQEIKMERLEAEIKT